MFEYVSGHEYTKAALRTRKNGTGSNRSSGGNAADTGAPGSVADCRCAACGGGASGLRAHQLSGHFPVGNLAAPEPYAAGWTAESRAAWKNGLVFGCRQPPHRPA